MIINNNFLQQVARTNGAQKDVARSVTQINVSNGHANRSARILAIYANLARIKKVPSFVRRN